MILYEEGATEAQHAEAHEILNCLTVAYPGHPWAVRVYDGGFFIRHLDFPANWGKNCKHQTRLYSASALSREVIRMAGEWLERAGLRRGRWDGESSKWVEGVPSQYQPPESKPSAPFESIVVSETGAPLRTEVRPQAIKEAA